MLKFPLCILSLLMGSRRMVYVPLSLLVSHIRGMYLKFILQERRQPVIVLAFPTWAASHLWFFSSQPFLKDVSELRQELERQLETWQPHESGNPEEVSHWSFHKISWLLFRYSKLNRFLAPVTFVKETESMENISTILNPKSIHCFLLALPLDLQLN